MLFDCEQSLQDLKDTSTQVKEPCLCSLCYRCLMHWYPGALICRTERSRAQHNPGQRLAELWEGLVCSHRITREMVLDWKRNI